MGGQSAWAVCARIQVINPKSSQYLEDGVLFLDTNVEFTIPTTRKLEEIIDINKISIDQVIPFDLPITEKNKAELGDFMNPNVANFDFKPIPVQVIIGSEVLTHTLLHVRETSEAEKRISVELRNDDSHWIVGCKKLKCRDITWDDFTINLANITSNWANNYKYLDGDIGLWFPLVFYGAWYETGNVTFKDLRPWVHLLAVLQKGFSDIGWIFKCPFLETDFGRQLGCYLIDPLYGTDSFDKRKYSVAARTSAEQNGNFQGILILGYEEFDEDGAYDQTNGYYRADGSFNFRADLLVHFTGIDPGGVGGRFQINIIKKTANGTEILLGTKDETILTIDGDAHYITIDIYDVLVSQTDIIYLTADIQENDFGLWSVYFKATPTNSISFNDGQVLHYPDLFPKNLRLYDVMNGLIHLINGKIHTDRSNRTVTVYAAFTATHFGIEVEGYYKEDQINDLIENQIVESSLIETIDIAKKRYLRLQFKDSSDARIQGLNFPKDNPPFSKTYDISEVLEEDTEVSANPFFEPTVNDDVTSILSAPLQIDFLKIGIPFCVDNSDERASFNIQPRILYFSGYHGLKTPEGKQIYWRFNNATYSNIPFAFQYTTYKKLDGSNFDKWLVYGNRENELFDKFWKRDLIESLYNFNVEILHYSLPHHHFGWDFREYYKFQSFTNQVIGRMIESRDHDGCGNTATPIKLIPQSNRSDVFYPDPDANNKNCSSQRAKLIVTESPSGTYTFTVDNSAITRTIVSQTIRWKYVSSSTWTVGTSVVNPTGKFQVQVQTQIEGCPDNFDSKFVDPCGQNYPAIIWEYRQDSILNQHCIKASVGGIINDAILTVTGTKTIYIVTGTSSSYTEGTEVCLASNYTKICVSFEIQFDNTCDPITIESCFDFTDIVLNCDDNNPVAQCVSLGIGAFGLQIAGNWVSKIQAYFLQYRAIGADDNSWTIWDYHEPLFPGAFEARVVVFWCDNCPPICSAPIQCIEAPSGQPMFISNVEFMDQQYSWDWDKLPDFEKKNMKDYFYNKEFGKIMIMHNQYKLSDYKYCCGQAHLDGVKAWVQKGIDEGRI